MVKQATSSEALKHSLDRVFSASIGVILIRTREARRAASIIHEWASGRECDYGSWNIADGLQNYLRIPTLDSPDAARGGGDDGKVNYSVPYEKVAGTGALSDTIQHVFARSQDQETGIAVTVMFAQHFFEFPELHHFVREFNAHAYSQPDRLIFLCPPAVELPADIADEFEVIELDTPGEAELIEAWEDFTNELEDDIKPELSEEDVMAIIRNSKGMTLSEFEESIALAFVDISTAIENEEGTLQEYGVEAFLTVIQERKIALLKSTSLLELMETVDEDQVGGLDLLKKWLRVKKSSFIDPAARQFGVDRPKGVLCVGPPGTGKSLIAKACGAIFQVPIIKFDVGRVFGGIVGQSEGNMRQALKMVEDSAPCVMFIDEIDKGFSSNGGNMDGGTSSRVFGTLLTWMQECKADVFIVATANNPDVLPPELVRKGRFNEIFAVNMPTQPERIEIARIHFKKRGHSIPDSFVKEISKETSGFVGSEIEVIVNDIIEQAFSTGDQELSLAYAKEVIAATQPLSVSYATLVARQKEWAKNNARPASTEVPNALPSPKRAAGATRTIRRRVED